MSDELKRADRQLLEARREISRIDRDDLPEELEEKILKAYIEVLAAKGAVEVARK